MGAPGRNDSSWLVLEYLKMKRLAEIGITVSASELTEEMIMGFLTISSEFKRLENEDLKRQARKSNRGSRRR